MNIRQVMTDPALFGDQFGGDSWAAWRALLAGFYGLDLSENDRATFKNLTGLSGSSPRAHEELWLAVGRRGGKSQVAALMAVYEAAFHSYEKQLAPGEVATIMVLAGDRKQARTVLRYVAGLMRSNPMLERMIQREDSDSIQLTNHAAIEVHTASFRAVRGYTVACCICDEIAFWRSEESANPDYEILNAIRPAMATLGGKLIALSSPYSKRGELWNAYRRYYGKPADVLVASAPSRTMNPSLPQSVVDRAMERDPEAAKAEYLAEFRSDLSSFVSREIIEGLARTGPLTIPFDRSNVYRGFVDPSGGGQDEFTMCIGHESDGITIVDLIMAQRGTPATIVGEYAAVLAEYGVHSVIGDRYAGSWPADEFKRHGITLEHSAKVRSDLYRDALSVINSGRCELPPDPKILNQFIALERRTSRSGKDTIDHGPGGHDDRANVIAGLLAHGRGPSAKVELWKKLAENEETAS